MFVKIPLTAMHVSWTGVRGPGVSLRGSCSTGGHRGRRSVSQPQVCTAAQQRKHQVLRRKAHAKGGKQRYTVSHEQQRDQIILGKGLD